MALKKVRSNIDRIFDKSLTDLIRGIRNNKENEARYIAACMEEIKMELRQDSIYVKANAIEKLAYLQMLGYNISWASFNIIEVMASTKYTEKRIGYLAAAQSFHDETDVLMLTTNLIRKDVNSPNMYDSGVALNGLSCFITPDLARDLASDILNLLSSSRPYTRKRAVLLLFKVFLKYPDALRPTFPKLKEKLEDSDPGVQSAAVNVICELARKNPKNYLTLAPVFFKLMTTSCNNWMLIKIIKLFGALVPLEPRLGKKLLEPLTNLINSTSAMSLLYECINTVIAVLISISAGGDHTASIQLCVQKLGVLIEDSDQNLKYLGLLAMGKILKTHPKAVQAHKDIVLRCLDDKDESIRLRSLDLLYGMVSKKNIAEIVKKLMEHVEAAEGSHYRDELLSRVLGICSYNNYHYVSNFEWYISVLVELTKVEGTKHGQKIAEQIQDVTVRVESIRHFSVSQMALLIENAHLLLAGSTQQRNNLCEVLLAAAWICGEYSQHVQNVQGVLDAMLRAKTSIIPGHILSVYVQNIGKLYANLLNTAEEEDDWDAIETLDNLMLSKLPQFELAEHLEAQERACTLMSILKIVEQQHQQKIKMGEEISHLYEGELNPVAQKAQKKVPVPEGLDLNEWLGDPWESTPEESSDSEFESTFGQPAPRYNINSPENEEDDDEEEEEVVVPVKHKRKSKKEEAEELRKKREQEIENNPYYVKGKATVPKRPTKFVTSVEKSASKDKMNEIQSPLEIPGVVGLNKYMEQQDSTLSWKKAKKTKKPLKKSKKTRRRKTSTSSEEESIVVHKVNREDGEMPEGAKSTDDEDNMKGVSDEFKALDIDLDAPLRPDEIVRAPQAYTRIYPQKQGPLVPRPPTIESRPQEIGYNNQYLVPSVKEPKKKTKKVKSDREENGEKKKTKKKKKPLVKNGSEQNILNVDDWLEEQTTTATVEKARDTLVAEKKTKKKAKKNRDAYEETSGICTPSVPTASTAFEDLAEDFTLIAANKEISADVSYRASLDAMEFGRVAVALRLKNVTSQRVKNVKLTTVDTLNAKVVKRDEDTLTLLDALGSGESNVANFDVQVKNTTMANTIRGTLTYFLESEEGSSEEKLDLRLSLSASTFLVGTPISNQEYSRILSSEDVDYASSRSVVTTATLKQALTHVVKKGHFRVIEETARAASLFAKTISSEPVCLLVKKTNDGIQIDGKAGDERLIIAVVQDIAEICART